MLNSVTWWLYSDTEKKNEEEEQNCAISIKQKLSEKWTKRGILFSCLASFRQFENSSFSAILDLLLIINSIYEYEYF